MTISGTTRQALLLISAAALVAACGGGDQNNAGATTGATTGAAAAGDTAGMMAGAGHSAMAGMDHSNMPGMNRPAPKDADQEFLRMMSDHHEGLVQMGSAAMTKASKPETQADAHKLHTKQQEEQQKMLGMLKTSYGDSITPMVVPSNKAMNDSLAAKSGVEYDRTFYGNVVKHHQEGVKMVDDFLPRLTKPDVKQMAEKMKTDQQKEIAEMEKKMAAIKG